MPPISEVEKRLKKALKLQMTAATYNEHIAGVVLQEAGDSYTIITEKPASLPWLDFRLKDRIVGALTDILGYEPEIVFTIGQGAPTPAPSERPTLAHTIARADHYAAFFGAGGAGYAPVAHYAAQFWSPYLGDAFLLWKRLDAEDRRSVKDVAARWSPPERCYYRKLAKMMNRSHPRCVAGSAVECWQSAMYRRDNNRQLPECCQNPKYQPVQWQQSRQGIARCMHWQVGMLEALFDEGLVAVELRRGQRWENSLKIQVWRLLPLLTPAQVERLTDDLRDDHERWLKDFGHLLGVTVAIWREIDAPSLVPLMDGYDSRELHDEYNPRTERGF